MPIDPFSSAGLSLAFGYFVADYVGEQLSEAGRKTIAKRLRDRYQNPGAILRNHDLTRLVGDGLRLCVRHYADLPENNAVHRKLNRLADHLRTHWISGENAAALEDLVGDEAVPDLVHAMNACQPTPEGPAESPPSLSDLPADQWDAICRAAFRRHDGDPSWDKLGGDLHDGVVQHIRAYLPLAVRELLKHDAAGDGKAYAGFHLLFMDCVREDLSTLKSDLGRQSAELQTIVDHLKQLGEKLDPLLAGDERACLKAIQNEFESLHRTIETQHEQTRAHTTAENDRQTTEIGRMLKDFAQGHIDLSPDQLRERAIALAPAESKERVGALMDHVIAMLESREDRERLRTAEDPVALVIERRRALAQRKTDGARRLRAEASKAVREALSEWREVAESAYLVGEIRQALDAAERMLELDPASFDGLRLKGDVYLIWGQLETAESHYEQARGAARPDSAEYARALNNLGNVHRTRGDLDQAEEAYNKALKLHEQLGSKEGQAINWGSLGNVHLTRGDLDQAEEAYNKSLKLNEQLGSKEGQARNWGNLGIVHETRGDLDQAEEAYNKALKLHEQLGSKEGQAINWGSLGNVHLTRGDLDQAEEAYNKSLKLNEQLGSKEGQARNWGNLGIVHETRGDLDQAEEAYNKALKLDEQLGRKEGQANNWGNLGNVHLTRGDLDQAEEEYNKALKLNEQLGRKEGQANNWGSLGNVHLTRGDLDQAEEAYNKSLKLNEQLGSKEGQAINWTNLGILMARRERKGEACDAWSRAIGFWEALGRADKAEEMRRRRTRLGCAG